MSIRDKSRSFIAKRRTMTIRQARRTKSAIQFLAMIDAPSAVASFSGGL